MKIDDAVLSAFLDGEVTDAQAAEIEEALAADPDLLRSLEALLEADAVAKEEFAAIAEEAVPFSLAAAINAAPDPAVAQPANDTAAPERPERGRLWLVAASVAGALGVGSGAGFLLGRDTAPVEVASRGWLAEIADYHAVYATQVRHLVEVPAAEADHIQTWLTATLGSQVTIPDLADQGLTFEGARLLVAVGRPVAQLVYTDADARVVALCQIASASPRDGFQSQVINAFEMVSWGGADANFVIVGDEGYPGLDEIAAAASERV